MTSAYTLDHFTPLLNKPFRIVQPEIPEPYAPIDVVLIEVKDLSVGRDLPEGFREPFSLLFKGPISVRLPQSMYRLSTAEGAEFALFLVPVGQEEEGILYESILA